MQPTNGTGLHPLDALVAWSLVTVVAIGLMVAVFWRALPVVQRGGSASPPTAFAVGVASPSGSYSRARVLSSPTEIPTITPTSTPEPEPTATRTTTPPPTPTLMSTSTPTVVPTPSPLVTPPTPELMIANSTAAPSPTPTSFIHVVEAGETLNIIATRYGTSVEVLSEINELSDPDIIEEGQLLIIPTGP